MIVGVEVKFKNQCYPVIIAPTHVTELSEVTIRSDGVDLGASVTLSTLNTTLSQLISSHPEEETRLYRAIVEMLRWFAGPQIRNVSVSATNMAVTCQMYSAENG